MSMSGDGEMLASTPYQAPATLSRVPGRAGEFVLITEGRIDGFGPPGNDRLWSVATRGFVRDVDYRPRQALAVVEDHKLSLYRFGAGDARPVLLFEHKLPGRRGQFRTVRIVEDGPLRLVIACGWIDIRKRPSRTVARGAARLGVDLVIHDPASGSRLISKTTPVSTDSWTGESPQLALQGGRVLFGNGDWCRMVEVPE